MPNTLCQPCASKVEDLQNFYNNCQEAQKILAVQYGCNPGMQLEDEGKMEGQSLMVSHVHDSMVELVEKHTLENIVPCPTVSAILSTDKLLETAIKDTCILSEEESDDTDSMDDGMSMEEQSAGEEEKV